MSIRLKEHIHLSIYVQVITKMSPGYICCFLPIYQIRIVLLRAPLKDSEAMKHTAFVAAKLTRKLQIAQGEQIRALPLYRLGIGSFTFHIPQGMH